MANIFHRPMFRRGGSVANGTGITSGLDSHRARYAEGTNEDAATQEDTNSDVSSVAGMTIDPRKYNPEILKSAINTIRGELEPSQSERMTDFLTSFGASAGDPTELQSVGSALGKATKSYQAIEQQRRQLAEKYAGTAAVAALKGMSKQDLLAIEKKARAAVANKIYGEDISDDETYKRAFKELYDAEVHGKGSQFLKTKSDQDKQEDLAKQIQAKSPGTEYIEAYNIAGLQRKFINDPKFYEEVGPRYKGLLSSTFTQKQPDGSVKIKADKMQSQIVQSYQPNDIYFDPYGKTLYMYEGKGIFKPYKKI